MAFNTTNLILHSIDLDFKQSSFCSIPVEQYDKDSAYIEAELFDGGSPYTIPVGSTASFGGTKPSSHIVLETATIENNKIYYKISEQCTVKEGDYPVKFTLYLPNNAVKYTQEFKIKVRKAVMSSDAIADVDEVNVLNELIVSATEAIGDVNNATTNAINATSNANIKATFANEKAILADEKATLANNAATLANEKAILANEKAGLANTATTNANTATNNANTATNLANEKAGLANMAATNANDVATQLSNETLKIYKGVVVSYSDLATTYPNPENGWTVTVSSESASYRYNGTEWINLGVISSVGTATDTTLGVVKGSDDVHISIDGAMSVPNKLDKTGDSKDNIITFEDYTTTTPIPSAEAALSEILSGKKHNSLWSNIKAFCNGVITVGKLANNLITTNEGLALDARQGKVLGDQIDTINNKLSNHRPTVKGDFTPGNNFIVVGELNEGFMGFVQPSEMGQISSNPDGSKEFNGANLALAIGLASGTAFNSNVPLMKFHSNGKVLFIPLAGYRHSTPWDSIYNAGAAYGSGDEGLLPPSGRLGTNLSIDASDNSINCTNQYFLGDKSAGMDYADTVGAVGDKLVLKGWSNTGNNATVTIVSITNTKIIVSGATLVTEQGGKSSRFYNQAKSVTQNKIVTIGDKQYRIRLIKGSGSNPTDSINDADGGSAGADNEWNSLILPLHEHAKLGNWNYPQYAVDSNGVKITSDWNIGLTDENLRAHSAYGTGSYSWCQETIDNSTWRRVFRGGIGASYSTHDYSWRTSSAYCWRPVLESL